MDPKYLLMEWQNGFEATLDARVVLTDTYIPMTPVPNGNFGRLVLEDTSKENFEIIRYTSKDAHGVFVEAISGGLRNEDSSSSGIHPRGARVRGNITAQDLREWRASAKAVQDSFTAFIATLPDWRPITQVPTVVSSNGQKEHVIRYTGVNLTTSLDEGMKLRIPRTGTTPTTSMSFVAASSQSASKASPAGLSSFTDFSIEGLIYVPNYTASSVAQVIASRINVGSINGGWYFNLRPDGTLQVGYAGGVNLTTQGTIQAVGANQWIHVAATVVVASKTIVLYINGVAVPLQAPYSNSSTTITHPALDLTIGAYSATPANSYFNGQSANLRLWSTVRTPAEIRDNMGKEVPASTTGLIGQWKGNGSWNDNSANANHLTPANGAINNFASHAYAANEFAYITKKPVFSGGNTDVTIFTGPCFLPNETLGQSAFATNAEPFGFPAGKDRWSLIWSDNYALTTGNSTLGYSNPNGIGINVPTGRWKIINQFTAYLNKGGAGAAETRFYLGTSPTTNQIAESEQTFYTNLGTAGDVMMPYSKEIPYVSAALAPVYFQIRQVTSVNNSGFRGDFARNLTIVEIAYP
ncbi:MAG: LamG domain-containing protein [Candidatus Saccharimonadaceae bacterium]